MKPSPALQRRRIEVRGIVQGVGFRPFVYRLAQQLGLTGWVRNDTAGVSIEVDGTAEALDAFARRLRAMRSRGLLVRGLCWYSRGDQFDWDTALSQPVGRLTEVGLFTQQRAARPVAQRFAALARDPSW